jgi:hypothetical protein
MSLNFNDTTNLRGLVQMYEREIGASRGDVSGNVNRLKEYTADANLAIDAYMRLAFPSDGKWKLDDANHDDLPTITTDLIAGQRNYTFDADETGNVLLDIYKVYVLNDGQYVPLDPVDPDTEKGHRSFYNGLNEVGTASAYDMTANIVKLDRTPSQDVTDGLKVSINREASYFTHTDTNKTPGFYGIHHPYFYLVPAEDYARRNGLDSHNRIVQQLMKLEREIKEAYNRRNRDVRPALNYNIENNR